MKKISILLFLALLFQTVSGLCMYTASAETVSYPILYDFSEGMDTWQVRNGENSRLSVEDEGDGPFLRLTALKETAHSQTDTLRQIPAATVVFPDAFVFPAEASVVISTDIRTNDFSQLEKIMMINRDQIKSDNVQYHLASLWGWTPDNKVNTYHEQNNRPVDGYYRAKTSTCFEGKLENNKWYTFRTEIFTDSSAKPAALKLLVFDGETEVYAGEKVNITNTSLCFSDRITSLDIGMANTDMHLKADTLLDIDNISVTSDGGGKYWMVSGGDILMSEEITIRFSSAMDAELLNANIQLCDSQGVEIPYVGEYNESKFIYTISPKQPLTSGQYAIHVNKDALQLAEDAQDSCMVTIFLSALPEVGECKASGRLENGCLLTATAEYMQAEDIPGSCRIQWMYAESQDGVYTAIPGATGTTFTVTEDNENSYIRFVATPVTDAGIAGPSKESNTLVPLLKPTAEAVKISGMPMVGMEAGISYTFTDPNGDAEGKSIYTWYISSERDGGWEKLDHTSRYLTLDESMVGMYLQAAVTPVSTDSPTLGDTVSSEGVFGPIIQSESMNLVFNPGFETGTTDGWTVRNMGSDKATLTATQEDAYSGEWCARFDGQNNASTFIRYGVPLKADTAYIISTAMKLTPDCPLDNVTVSAYNTNENDVGVQEKIVSNNLIKKTEWTQVYIYCYATKDANNVSVFPVYWANAPGYSVYIDDMYVAPLVVEDIDVQAIDRVYIPESGEKVFELAAYNIKNQFGNNVCLENETVYWTIDEEVPGVRVQDSKLYVSDWATAGTIALKAVCEPSFEGAVQQRFSKTISVELIAHADKTPKIKSISVNGETELNSVLQLQYAFYQVDGLADASTISWYVADTEDGIFTEIPGETGMQLIITDAFVGKFIKAVVRPIDSEGNIGPAAESNISGPAQAPEARQIAVSGKTYCGQVLNGSYQFFDFNGDKEGESLLKWYRAQTENGEYSEIPGAVGKTYTITEDDINNWIRFGVTPISQKAPNEEMIYYSEAIQGPVAPIAANLSIKKNGLILTGSYTYESLNGAPEGETKCEWYINGSRVATGTQYKMDTSSSGTIEFRVTPVSQTKPYIGEPASTTYRIFGNTSNSGNGGGGISTSGPSPTILPELPSKEQEEDPESGQFTDIPPEMEWAKEAIEALAGYGIINGRADGIFAPTDNVTRAEFLRMLMETLQIEDPNAECSFSDVQPGEWYYVSIATAFQKEIVKGYEDGSFGIMDPITRQDAAVMIVNALDAADKELKQTQEPIIFTDQKDISGYAAPAVERLVKAEILNGSEGFFLPREHCTRAQAAVMLNRLINVCEIKYEK